MLRAALIALVIVVGLWASLALLAARLPPVLWVLSPIDLVPEFLPVIGPLDDMLVVALALRYAGRCVPRSVLLEAWPGDPRLLDWLLGPPREVTSAVSPPHR